MSMCEPAAQTINDLAEALLASRSAITQAVVLLENRGLVQWSERVASAWTGSLPAWMPQPSSGTSIRPASPTRQHCSGAEPPCWPATTLADARPWRSTPRLHDFLAEKFLLLKQEWLARRVSLRGADSEEVPET